MVTTALLWNSESSLETKTHPKLCQTSTKGSAWVLWSVFVFVALVWEASTSQKSYSYIRITVSGRKTAFCFLNPLWVPALLHFGLNKCPKSEPKAFQMGIKRFIDFGIDLWSLWAPSWDPTWAQNKSPQRAPRCPQAGHMVPKCSKTGVKMVPKQSKIGALGRFGKRFGGSLGQCWWDLGKIRSYLSNRPIKVGAL